MRIVILGAGISGLSLAWFLQKKFGNSLHITLLEASHRSGGWIQTIDNDNFQFELGPHSCRIRGSCPELLELIKDLELENELVPASKEAKKRFLFLNNKLIPFPHTLFSSLFSPLMKGVPQAIFRDLFSKRGDGSDESIYSFFTRRFGTEITERFIDPIVTGIYAGDIHSLSMQSSFPKLFQYEQQHRSVILGMLKQKKAKKESLNGLGKQAIFSFRKGMQTLTDTLQQRLQSQISFNSKVEKIHFDQNSIEVSTSDGKLFQADHLFSTLPTWALVPLFAQHHKSLKDQLANIEYASLTIVHFGFNSLVLQQEGFGYLIPSNQKENILGVIWDSSVFPQHNKTPQETRLAVMIQGTLNKNEACKIAQGALKRHLGISHKPIECYVSTAPQAIPQYKIGHSEKIASIHRLAKQVSPRLNLLGSAFNGVSIGDCIANANQTASSFYNEIQRVADTKVQ
jgi:oxygen-dependent protoporphyrinogen oxidase